jgi:phytoene dehydrogenase-like protein
VFLDRELAAPASLFHYLFRCFASGDATIPAGGMGRLPEAIAEPLGHAVRTNCRVRAVDGEGVELDDGTRVAAGRVVVATDGFDASRLLDGPASTFTRAVTAWYAVQESPLDRPLLVLDGEGEGPVNHLAVVSEVADGLAPLGWSLVAASGSEPTAGPAATFAERAAPQLERWFGSGVRAWRHLHTHEIPRALPRMAPTSRPGDGFRVSPDGVVRVGDHEAFAAIQGALRSGRRAAEFILEGAPD